LKLLILEPGSEPVRRAWSRASSRWASVALLAEARAGLASANRSGRSSDVAHAESVRHLGALWNEIDALELTEPLARRAGELAELCALRGYDAIHLASAEAILDEGDVMIVSDTRLAEAAASLGMDALVPAET
jgi:predicted nucleic acid-binding protein